MKELVRVMKLKNLQRFLEQNRLVFEEWAKYKKVECKEELPVEVTIRLPKVKRTTGYKSQNHALNGFIQQICEFTGQDFHTTKEFLKNLAIDNGYPIKTKKVWRDGEVYEEDCKDWYGRLVGISEADSSKEECSILIETTVHFMVEELGIIPKEM